MTANKTSMHYLTETHCYMNKMPLTRCKVKGMEYHGVRATCEIPPFTRLHCAEPRIVVSPSRVNSTERWIEDTITLSEAKQTIFIHPHIQLCHELIQDGLASAVLMQHHTHQYTAFRTLEERIAFMNIIGTAEEYETQVEWLCKVTKARDRASVERLIQLVFLYGTTVLSTFTNITCGTAWYSDTMIQSLNHSCAPNCCLVFEPQHNWRVQLISLVPIHAGDEITITYNRVQIEYLNLVERRASLRRHFAFECRCARCKHESVDQPSGTWDLSQVCRHLRWTPENRETSQKTGVLEQLTAGFERCHPPQQCKHDVKYTHQLLLRLEKLHRLFQRSPSTAVRRAVSVQWLRIVWELWRLVFGRSRSATDPSQWPVQASVPSIAFYVIEQSVRMMLIVGMSHMLQNALVTREQFHGVFHYWLKRMQSPGLTWTTFVGLHLLQWELSWCVPSTPNADGIISYSVPELISEDHAQLVNAFQLCSELMQEFMRYFFTFTVSNRALKTRKHPQVGLPMELLRQAVCVELLAGDSETTRWKRTLCTFLVWKQSPNFIQHVQQQEQEQEKPSSNTTTAAVAVVPSVSTISS